MAQGLAPSRERAQSLILAGKVLAGDEPVAKSGQLLDPYSPLRLRGEDHPYVSRGGVKLASALDQFGVAVAGRAALDIGASTGGFTHVLLLRGAAKVFAYDVGHQQLDWKIRQDPRVVVREKFNARYLVFEDVGEKAGLVVVDVSFISLDKILPAVLCVMTPETDLITLIKPQFEIGKEKVGKGGLVTADADHQEVLSRVKRDAERLGLHQLGLINSPIAGTQGNREFLAHWRMRGGEAS